MWNLIDYIPWVVVFDFNSLIIFFILIFGKIIIVCSSLFVAKRLNRIEIQYIWFSSTAWIPNGHSRKVSASSDWHRANTIFDYALQHCSRKVFFYLWVCANLCLYTFHLPTMHESNAHHDTGRCSSRKTFEQKQNKQ